MNVLTRHLALATIIAIAVSGVTAVRADAQQNAYVVTNLVSDLAGKAAVQDPNLKNAWGVAFTPAASPFWIADNATGLATLYDGDGTIVPLVVTIPCPPTAGQGSNCPQTAAPNGMVWNPTTTVSTAFLVPGTKLPANRGAQRHGVEPYHECQHGIPGPGNKVARFVHLRYRGRDDIRLDRRPLPC